MLRPEKEEDKPQANMYRKFARIFGLLMTLVYVALGVFIMFATDTMRLSISSEIRYVLGGVLILYGVVRFIRVYQTSAGNKRNRYED